MGFSKLGSTTTGLCLQLLLVSYIKMCILPKELQFEVSENKTFKVPCVYFSLFILFYPLQEFKTKLSALALNPLS